MASAALLGGGQPLGDVMAKAGVHAVAPSHAANLLGRGLDVAQSAAPPAHTVKMTVTDRLQNAGPSRVAYGGA